MKRPAWIPGAVFAVGFALNLLGLLSLYEAPRLRADVRGAGWGGPGMGLVLRDAWPAPGERARVTAVAWGGLRVGIEEGRVRLPGVAAPEDPLPATPEGSFALPGAAARPRDDRGPVVFAATGQGATWGDTLVGQRGAAADEVELVVPIPPDAPLGVPVPVVVELDWVAAQSSEALGFTDEHGGGALRFELTPASPSERWLGRARAAVLPLVALGLMWRLAGSLFRLTRAYGEDQTLLVGLGGLALGIGVLGYWVFAWPLARAFGAPPTLDVVLAVVFIGVPVARFLVLDHRDR